MQKWLKNNIDSFKRPEYLSNYLALNFRAVLQNQEAKCILEEGLCTDLKFCRGCRYKKCLAFGMSIKGFFKC